jgi:hypothetical protein
MGGLTERLREGRSMGRRRDYDEGYEDARKEMMDRENGGGEATAPLPPPSSSSTRL